MLRCAATSSTPRHAQICAAGTPPEDRKYCSARQAPETADEWREWRRKESVSARKPADDELARRAQRWAEAVGADASTLDGLPEARRREFLDEFERDLPKNDPAPRTAPTEDAPTEINVDWERRVQFDALRDGNALRQNDVLNQAIRSDK